MDNGRMGECHSAIAISHSTSTHMGVVIPLQRERHLHRTSRQLRLAYPTRRYDEAMRACLDDLQREEGRGRARATVLWPARRSPNDPSDAA